MSERPDYAHLNNVQRFAQWVVYELPNVVVGPERDAMIAEAETFFAKLAEDGKVVVRGIYDISGMRPGADFMIWSHAEKMEELQAAYNAFRRSTALGRLVEPTWIGTALHRPAEFNKSHLPSFIMGEDPGAWITVYPFVRSYDWYLMDPSERRKILADHGRAGRNFPQCRANTVEAFAMTDYEWILCFESPDLQSNVDLMHAMRYTQARLHVREETPFFSGRRVENIGEIIKLLP
ncbi:MAG: chlorite dismutase family protein [Corynebacterium sp.]|nr:chlorite dismutase family protein [Corynebacterium sp.]